MVLRTLHVFQRHETADAQSSMQFAAAGKLGIVTRDRERNPSLISECIWRYVHIIENAYERNSLKVRPCPEHLTTFSSSHLKSRITTPLKTSISIHYSCCKSDFLDSSLQSVLSNSKTSEKGSSLKKPTANVEVDSQRGHFLSNHWQVHSNISSSKKKKEL